VDCWRSSLLGHGDTQSQPSPKRVKALRGVPVSSVSIGPNHALALTTDGLLYAWGANTVGRTYSNEPIDDWELLPKPIEKLRRVRVRCVACGEERCYAVADTGEVWAWECGFVNCTSRGYIVYRDRRWPKPLEGMQGIKVDAVVASDIRTLALADDVSVYAWGDSISVREANRATPKPQLIPALRLACWR
jgi:alpha-tubulin suppressor-like RCC1 family protein